ncbi:MAG: CHAT domain-containing protein [Anaerolineae bacterium]|nr:CHAT domain-containing protein [Anaerolineae bacterium]
MSVNLLVFLNQKLLILRAVNYCLLVLVFLSSSPSQSFASDEKWIAYNQIVEDNLPSGVSQTWLMEGQGDDCLTILVTGNTPHYLSADIDLPRIELLDPIGRLITSGHGTGWDSSSVIGGVELPTSGTFQIQVSSLVEDRSFDYSLAVQRLNHCGPAIAQNSGEQDESLKSRSKLKVEQAKTYRDSGDYFSAIEHYVGALQIWEEINWNWWEETPDDISYLGIIANLGTEASLRSEIGRMYLAIGDSFTALRYTEQAQVSSTAALIAARRYNQFQQVEVMPSIQYAAGVTNLINQNYELALKDLNRALEAPGFLGPFQISEENLIKSAFGLPNQEAQQWSRGRILLSLGIAYERMEQYQQAISAYEQAYKVYDSGSPFVPPDQGGATAALIGLGRISHQRGQNREALTYLGQALAFADDLNDPGLQSDARSELGFIEEKMGRDSTALDHYSAAIALREKIRGDLRLEEFKLLFDANTAQLYERIIPLLLKLEKPIEAFDYAERARARAFLDQLAVDRIDFRAGANQDLLQQEQQLRAEIAHLRTQSTTTSFELKELEAEYARLLVELKRQSPTAASLVSVDTASLAEIQNLLGEGTTLVEFFVTDQNTYVFIVTRQKFEVIEINVSRQQLFEAILIYHDFAETDSPNPDTLRQLYEWLIQPVATYLETDTILIVPHGILHYVPFAALTDGTDYFIDKYVPFTLPSASALRFVPDEPQAFDTALVIGNPTGTGALSSLPFAEKEAQSVAELFQIQPLLGNEATETIFRAKAGRNNILHIAAHGVYNPDSPLFSSIYLTSDNQHDGRLDVLEIYDLDLTDKTSLVVLSACETQLGAKGLRTGLGVTAGDEVVGLTRSFLYAGTPSVIASLWVVEDEATSLLMERFYTHLKDGMSKAKALRLAQIEVRAKYPNPYYWSAFVLSGDEG